MKLRGRGGRGLVPLPPLLAAVVVAMAPAPAAATTGPRLQALLQRSRLVVSASVAGETEYDDGRVALVTLRVGKLIKGVESGDRVAVVEMRDRPNAAAVFRKGADVVAFLRPADRNSYLRQHLPVGDYFQAVADPAACLSTMAADEAAETAALVERVARLQRGIDADAAGRVAAERGLTFDLIAARSPILVEDGAAGLPGIAGLAGNLTPEERARLEKALSRDDLPAAVRIAVIRAIGAAHLQALAETLRGLRKLTPDLQAAVWAALAQMGTPVDKDELARQFGSPDSGTRAAAVQAYLRETKVEGIPRAGAVALHDRDLSVRIAAIEALGELERPEALPTLRQAFADPSSDIYQAAGRAILAVGGRPAAEAFAQLVFDAPPESRRLALLGLMSLGVQPDDPLVVRIREQHPDPEMRELIEHGLEVHH